MEKHKIITAVSGTTEYKDESEYPDRDFPVVYSDGVASASRLRGLVKIYLVRVDAHPLGRGGASTVPIMQLVMPDEAVVSSAKFFIRLIGDIVKAGELPPEVLTEIELGCRAARDG